VGPAYVVTYLPEQRDQLIRTPPVVLMHRLPVIVVRGRRTRVHHDYENENVYKCYTSGAVSHGLLFPQRSTERRTVDTTSTTETLPTRHNHRAVPERRARIGDVYAHCVRARHKVRQETPGLDVCGIFICRGARLEYEDAKVRIRRCKTGGDDATSSTAYRKSPWSEESEVAEGSGGGG
jgi:hypothetical protein